jgi:Kelch motif
VMGGIVSVDDGEEYTSSTEIMDCHTGVWTAGPVMCARRAIDVAPIVVGGILYVVGGDVGKEVLPRIGDKLLGTIERYDPASKSFVVISTFPHQRKGFSSAALPGDDNIYCFGGREGDEDLTSWDAYNVSTNVWQSTLEPNTKYGELKMPFMDSLYGRAISLVP